MQYSVAHCTLFHNFIIHWWVLPASLLLWCLLNGDFLFSTFVNWNSVRKSCLFSLSYLYIYSIIQFTSEWVHGY